MKLVIAIVGIAGSAFARDRGPSHSQAGAHASAVHVRRAHATPSGFDGWPGDYLSASAGASRRAHSRKPRSRRDLDDAAERELEAPALTIRA